MPMTIMATSFVTKRQTVALPPFITCPRRRREAAKRSPILDSAPPRSPLAGSGLEGVEFMEDAGGIAVELGRGHDAEVAVAGLENGDADHEGRREIPCPRVGGFEGLRHHPAPV